MPPVPVASAAPTFSHRFHGLTLTADRPIAGLECSVAAAADGHVHVHFARWPLADRFADERAAPAYRSPNVDESGRARTVGWTVGDGFSWFVRDGGLQFVVDRWGREVWVDAGGADPTDPLIADYLLGPILGLVLRRRGTVCLHASAVEIDGFAVAFAGSEGVGKSTLAAACVLRGHTLVADDLTALVDKGPRFAVQPGPPRVHARAGVIEKFAERVGARDRLHGRAGSEYLELPAESPRARSVAPRPLAAVYVLDPAASEKIAPIGGAAAVMALTSDTWARTLLDPAERAHEFDVMSRLVTAVPIVRVAAGRGIDLLNLVETIEADRL